MVLGLIGLRWHAPRFSICMVLVCNWDDPSSADVDHILDILFTFTALFLTRDYWAMPTSTILLNSHHTLPRYTQYLYPWSGACLALWRMVDDR